MQKAIGKVIYAGVGDNEAYHTVLAKVTTNVVLLVILAVAIAWSFIAKTLLQENTLMMVHIIAAVLCFVLYVGMHRGATDKVKVVTICIMLFYFALCNIYLGFQTGVEFYAGPLFFGILVMTPEQGSWLS